MKLSTLLTIHDALKQKVIIAKKERNVPKEFCWDLPYDEEVDMAEKALEEFINTEWRC